MKWTKVEDELPKVGMLCLLKKTYPPGTTFNLLAKPLPRCHIVIGGLRYDGKFISYEDQHSDGINVSHWMELAKPPGSELPPLPEPEKPKDPDWEKLENSFNNWNWLSHGKVSTAEVIENMYYFLKAKYEK